MGLLGSLLKHNPFLGDLSSSNFSLELEKLEVELKAYKDAAVAAEIMKSEKLLAEVALEAKNEPDDDVAEFVSFILINFN